MGISSHLQLSSESPLLLPCKPAENRTEVTTGVMKKGNRRETGLKN